MDRKKETRTQQKNSKMRLKGPRGRRDDRVAGWARLGLLRRCFLNEEGKLDWGTGAGQPVQQLRDTVVDSRLCASQLRLD